MDQVAEVVVVIAHQFFAVDGDGGKAVDVETLVFGNKIVKEQTFQTTSKNVLRSSEKQKPRAFVPHTPYVRTEGFVRATACYTRHVKIGSFTQAKTSKLLGLHHSKYQLPKYLKSTLCNWTQQ